MVRMVPMKYVSLSLREFHGINWDGWERLDGLDGWKPQTKPCLVTYLSWHMNLRIVFRSFSL